MDRSKVGIIIPAFNEENSIANVLKQCRTYGIPIVVDDGSRDLTSEISRNLGAEVVVHAINKGYDEALNSGFQTAATLGCEFVVTIDADGQHAPELIDKYVELLADGADVVVGFRNEYQRFAERCFALMTRKLYRISDPLCGLKGYRMSVYNTLGHFDSYGSIGTELTLFAARSGCRIKQVPIVVSDRKGPSRFGPMLSANYKIFRAMLLSLFRI